MEETRESHVLFVTFCAQGHINPGLQFAKRLARHGVHVTFATSLSVYGRMGQTPTLQNLTFASYSDGFDGGFKAGNHDMNDFMSERARRGSQAVKDLIVSSAKQGNPFTYVVYSLLLPWVAEVARSLHLPSRLLWIQPATVFDLYYYYYNGYKDAISEISGDPVETILLSGLPILTGRDLPSFFHSSNIYDFVIPLVRKHFELLEEEPNVKVLVNTFDELERDAMRAISSVNLISIGPLIPSAFLDGNDPSDDSFGGDLYHSKSKDYIEWLNSKPKASVIYVSSGSVSSLPKQQKEEFARGLLGCGRPFLWVVREIIKQTEEVEEDKDKDGLSCREELELQGKIVPWCSQLEVLSNPAVGCFLTHCGWNSTLESLSCGVPVVVFPQWSDQPTNAKIVKDLSKTGVRLEADKEGVIGREEIRRCLELVMGDSERGEEIRRNAVKWKQLAKEAAMEGGSSYLNFKSLVDEICKNVN